MRSWHRSGRPDVEETWFLAGGKPSGLSRMDMAWAAYQECPSDITVSHVISGSFDLRQSYLQRDTPAMLSCLTRGNLAVCLTPNVSVVTSDLQALQVRD